MSYSYDTKRRNAIPESRSDIPDSVQQSFNAIQNVDIHSGRKLDLESSLKSRIEQNTGFRMDNVELRESSDAAAMDAKAFAKGNVVHFAPGQFDQHSEAGQHLIEHELTHVAQQARGGVRADVDGLNVNASEHFESQADSGMSFSGGALQALPTMNAEAAPIQGAFGGIKKFFSNIKKSFGFGKKNKAKDDAAKAINAEHAAETDEMVAAMRAGGFTEEEIEAQKLFQRINMSDNRGRRFQEAQAGMMDYGYDNDLDPSQMDNIWSKLGRGALTKGQRSANIDAEQHMLNNVLTGREEEAQAEQMAAALGRKYELRKNAADVNNVASSYNPIAMQQAAGATPEQNEACLEYIRDSRDINNYLRTGTAATGKEDSLKKMADSISSRMGTLDDDQMSFRSVSDVALLPIIEQLGLSDEVIKSNGMIDHKALMENKSKLIGTVFKDDAFVSTTASSGFAEKWGANIARRDRGVFSDRALRRHKFSKKEMSMPRMQNDIDLFNDKSLAVKDHNMTANFLADRIFTGNKAIKESDIGSHIMEIMMPKGTKAAYIDGSSGKGLGDSTIDNQQFEILLNKGSHFKINDIVQKMGEDGKAIPNQYRIMLELLKEEEEER